MVNVLIGQGRTGKVYLASGYPNPSVRKEFDPSYTAKVWNWIFYSSPHPLSTDAGISYAYWKRRLAHRLTDFVDGDLRIVDASGPSHKGFVSPFIEGHKPTIQDTQKLQTAIRNLEQIFDEIGMPTWSFGLRNPLAGSNFLMQDGRAYIIDYEQSIAIPDTRGNMGYDVVYFDDTNRFIRDQKGHISDKLGQEQTRDLNEALELANVHYAQLNIRQRKGTKFGERFSRTLSRRGIDSLVGGLYEEGGITKEELESYRNGEIGDTIKLILPHLGLHCAIGIATPTGIGAPISSALRFGWTAFNWGYYMMRHDSDKIKIHGPKVMLVSLIPGLGNFAYVIPIMEKDDKIGKRILKELFSF